MLPYIYDKKRRMLHKNFKIFRKISVLNILKCLDLVKITTNIGLGLKLLAENGVKMQEHRERGLTLLSVLSRLFVRLWAELGEIL